MDERFVLALAGGVGGGKLARGLAAVLPPGRLASLWQDAGIGGVVVRRLSFGAGIVMWGTRGGGPG